MFDDTARGHDNGLPERVLCASLAAGLLCGAAQSNGAGRNDEDDSTSAHLGATGYLYPGILLEGRRPGQGENERGGGVLYLGRQELCRQNSGGRAHDFAIVGSQRLCAQRSAVCADIQVGKLSGLGIIVIQNQQSSVITPLLVVEVVMDGLLVFQLQARTQIARKVCGACGL